MVKAEKTIHSSSPVAAVLMAAGQGKRMQSDIPKVLHDVAGKPILAWVLAALAEAGLEKVVLIIGGDLNRFDDFLESYQDVTVCAQAHRRGTGDAVASAAACFDGVAVPHYAQSRLLRGQKLHAEYVLISAGDTPAIDGAVIADFIKTCLDKKSVFAVLGMEIPDPTGYGRLVVTDQGDLKKIVEQRDANADELMIKLCNSGIIFARTQDLFVCLDELEANNSQREYYLTDIFQIASRKQLPTSVYRTNHWQSFAGINNPEQKKQVEDYMVNELQKRG